MARLRGLSRMAGTALYALVDEGEPGAEIYSAATTREQARIVFSEAERMRAASPALRRRTSRRQTNNLAVLDTASWFRPLSSDASKMDGLNVFVALVDEVHEHPNADVIEKLDTGMGTRLQPLMYGAHDRRRERAMGLLPRHWDFSTKVLEGTIPPWTPRTAGSRSSRRSTMPMTGQANSRGGARPTRRSARCCGSRTCSAEVDAGTRDAVEAELHPAPAPEPVDTAARALDRHGPLGAFFWLSWSFRSTLPRGWPAGRCFGGLDLARVNDLSSLALLFPPIDEEKRR